MVVRDAAGSVRGSAYVKGWCAGAMQQQPVAEPVPSLWRMMQQVPVQLLHPEPPHTGPKLRPARVLRRRHRRNA
eukprot:1658659-Prorocentrum_lima.AAC.1